MDEAIGRRLASAGKTIAVAESCTGGGIGRRLTSVSGSSAYFLGGIIAYANAVKIRELGVAEDVLDREGAVSAACARAMAEGVRRRFAASYGLSVTGVAGPGGGTDMKPVGLVFVALATEDHCDVRELRLSGGRERVRRQTEDAALALLVEHLNQKEESDHGCQG